MTGNLLYSRFEDGVKPVIIVQPVAPLGQFSYTVGSDTFTSKRQLLIKLTNHPEARNWTFDRYFRRGKYAPHTPWEQSSLSDSPIMALFGTYVTAQPVVPANDNRRFPTVTVYPRGIKPYSGIGIDLNNRHKEVAKLLFAGFGRRIYACGYDPDDVLQEVYKGLIVRNAGTCPYRPDGPASFGHYVHMVCGCILSNYSRAQKRIREHEVVGVFSPGGQDGESGGFSDVANSTIAAVEPNMESVVNKDFVGFLDKKLTVDKTNQNLSELVKAVLPMVIQGYGRLEIAGIAGVSVARTSKAMKLIKQTVESYQIAI